MVITLNIFERFRFKIIIKLPRGETAEVRSTKQSRLRLCGNFIIT